MRWIGTLNNEQQGLVFSLFLEQKGIGHHLEIHKETNWDSPDYGLSLCQIWINEEDQTLQAQEWLSLYQKDPADPLFKFTQSVSPPPLLLQKDFSSESSPNQTKNSLRQTAWEKQPLGIVTRSLIGICASLFLLVQLTFSTAHVPPQLAGWSAFSSPVEQALLYDFPKYYELIGELIRNYNRQENSALPATDEIRDQQLVKELKNTSMWQGLYALYLKKDSTPPAPLFEKIRQGEVWRLITPALLHADIFHIFFNMVWLLVLGKQIEQRLRPWRYLIFVFIVAIISNTAQYLMSGPNFIGFSGVITGMLAFIWVRQMRTAWEGYQIDRLTLLFMLVFILGMAGIQFFSFILERSFSLPLSPNIANTAHIVGGLTGYLLGHLNYFSWRHA